MPLLQQIIALAALFGVGYFIYHRKKTEQDISRTEWAIAIVAALYLLGVLRGNKTESRTIADDQTEEAVSTKENPFDKQVSVLKSENNPMVGYNIHFLVKNPSELTPELAKQIADYHCGTSCNMLYYWSNEAAFDLLMYKRTYFVEQSKTMPFDEVVKMEKKWERTNNHWIDICEGLMGQIMQGDESLYTYPYAREKKYRELGGKMRF
jgi:hypothetical protein